jgi:hypothetical protein
VEVVSFGSGGSSKSKSSSVSKTKFPRKFWDQAIDYFGPAPDYKPEFVGFDSFDDVEKTAYDSQAGRIGDAYDTAVKRRREELSLAGLLNSPNQYLEDGARASLDKDFLTNLQQAARDARLARLGVEQTEKSRRTAFNEETAMAIVNRWLSMMGLSASAGRINRSSGSGSSDGGFGFSLLLPNSNNSK